MPIGASSKALRKRSSLVRVSALGSSFIRHEATLAMHMAPMKLPWMAAHFHGFATAAAWS